MAKRAVLRATPEKMRKHVSDTAVAWLLDDIDTTTATMGLNERQRKYQKLFKGLMVPMGEALEHPAAPLLLEIATLGCRADVGE